MGGGKRGGTPEAQKVTNLLDFAISTLIQKFDPQNHGAWGQPGGGGGGEPKAQKPCRWARRASCAHRPGGRLGQGDRWARGGR